MRNASAKRRVKSDPFSNNLPDQNEEVNCNPVNPVNFDSKPNESGLIKHGNLSGRRREASRL